MKEGTKVRLNGLRSDNGRVWESLRADFDRGVVGTVVKVETHYHSCKGYALVEFPGIVQPMNVPIELLDQVRP